MPPVADALDQDRSMLRDLVCVVRGEAWFGVFTFYSAKTPGKLSIKAPFLCLLQAVLSRTIGAAAFAPIRAAIKAMWILVRVFCDYVHDAD